MKHHYFLAIAALATSITVSAAHPAQRFIHRHEAKTETPAKTDNTAKTLKMKSRSEAALWRPGKETVSDWINGQWMLESVNTYTYDQRGNMLTSLSDSEGEFYLETFTYDDNDMMTSSLAQVSPDGVAYENSVKTERAYDPVVTRLITSNKQYIWMTNTWQQLGNNYTYTVTRNEQGNVVALERAVLFQGIFDPTQRITVEYGEDGKAKTISSLNLEYDWEGNSHWAQGDKITDIVWENTDGQIVSCETLSFMLGANRIKSATVLSETETTTVNVEYTDELGSYKSVITGVDEDGSSYHITAEFKALDNYGSYTLNESYNALYPAEEEGAEPMTESIEIVENLTLDAYGNQLLMIHTEAYDGGEAEIYEWTQSAVNYDEAYGYPLECTIKTYDEEAGELTDFMKIVYSDYADVAGVNDIELGDNEESPAEYFNLQGVKVDNPTPGLYIRRQGNKATKVIIK